MRDRTVLQKARGKTYFRKIYRYKHSTVYILKQKEVFR